MFYVLISFNSDVYTLFLLRNHGWQPAKRSTIHYYKFNISTLYYLIVRFYPCMCWFNPNIEVMQGNDHFIVDSSFREVAESYRRWNPDKTQPGWPRRLISASDSAVDNDLFNGPIKSNHCPERRKKALPDENGNVTAFNEFVLLKVGTLVKAAQLLAIKLGLFCRTKSPAAATHETTVFVFLFAI